MFVIRNRGTSLEAMEFISWMVHGGAKEVSCGVDWLVRGRNGRERGTCGKALGVVRRADSRFRPTALPCRRLRYRSDFDDLPASRMNPLPLLRKKMAGRYQRTTADLLARRSLTLTNERPLISFTFDDFPKSALFTGGAILERYGARGTYYASFGLMDQITPTGKIFRGRDVSLLLQHGHELGCHTFAHCHAYETSPEAFERSILENARALESLVQA